MSEKLTAAVSRDDTGIWRILVLVYRGADKSLVRSGRKQATVTEDFDFHISYLQSQLEEY
jgi:hypothetical protein